MNGTTNVIWHFYRASRYLLDRGYYRFAHLVSAFCRTALGIEIVPGATIGGGLAVFHGQATVIGAGAVIGRNCTLHHEVTLGLANGAYPCVGDDVTLYPGAKIFGAVTIGDGAVVGANAVVLENVEPLTVVAGVPARVVGRTDGAS